MSQLQLKRILCPTDFSQYSHYALDYACGLAGEFQAELHLLHVLDDVLFQGLADPSGAYGLPANYEDKVLAGAEKSLSELSDSARSDGKRIVQCLRKGSPFVEIIRYARENNIDLIILGTHGRSGLSHVLLGSVAEKVVRKASCPVLTVRPPEHQFTMP